MRPLIAALTIALLLSACSTVGGLNSRGGGKALDAVHDDIASLLVAFDLPPEVGTAPTGSILLFDVANGGPSEHLRLTLVPVSGDAGVNNLPPPVSGHTYYFYGIAEADKPAILAAQASAQAKNLSASGIQLAVVPKLCTRGAIDTNSAIISVLGGVPGQSRFSPFLDRETLTQIMTQPGSTQIPYCA